MDVLETACGIRHIGMSVSRPTCQHEELLFASAIDSEFARGHIRFPFSFHPGFQGVSYHLHTLSA